MTENTQHNVARRNHLLEAAQRGDGQVRTEGKRVPRKKDREERAAELRLPLAEIKIH